MLRSKDILVLIASYSSLAGGIFFPELEPFLKDFPFYALILLLFFSFLPLKMIDMAYLIRGSSHKIISLVALKNLIIPPIIYFIVKLLFPEYALGALVLSGISSAVLGPFFASLVRANIALVVTVLIFSSLVVPFSLPLLIGCLYGTETGMKVMPMIKMLAIVILVPAVAGEVMNRLAPKVKDSLLKVQFPVSLLCIIFSNLGIFSKYSSFFLASPQILLSSLFISCSLGILLLAVGGGIYCQAQVEDQLAAMISLGCLNNVMALVFSARFFGASEVSLIAMYSITLFLLLVPLQVVAGLRRRGDPEKS